MRRLNDDIATHTEKSARLEATVKDQEHSILSLQETSVSQKQQIQNMESVIEQRNQMIKTL